MNPEQQSTKGPTADGLTSIIDNLQKLTFKRIVLGLVAAFVGIVSYTAWENRQSIFEATRSNFIPTGDIVLEKPSDKGVKFITALMAKYPQIRMTSIVDADLIKNQRHVVDRVFASTNIDAYVNSITKNNPSIGDAALFVENNSNANNQVLNVMNGEFACSKTEDRIGQQVFPELFKEITITCRVPLPPAFGKATGWFGLHLTQLPENYGAFKADALSMSLQYFDTEVSPSIRRRN